MKANSLLLSIIILLITATAQAQQWSKYIPEKQRKDIFKKSSRATGAGAVFSGQIGAATWLTDSMARALVSDSIDRERLTPEEAEDRYLKLRPENSYTFLITGLRLAMSPRGTSARTLNDPLVAAETFLQRGDDRGKFSKAEVADHQFDVNMGGFLRGSSIDNTYRVVFPKTDRSGSPLVRDLADKIEIQFNLSGKKIVFEYKLKELVTRLEDL